MRTFFRCLSTYRPLWRVWLPLAAVTVAGPALVLTMPMVEKYLIDDVILAGRLDRLLPTMAIYSGLWVATAGIGAINALCSAYLNERVTQDLRLRLLAHCDALGLPFSNSAHTGRTMSLFGGDVPAVAGLLSSTVFGGTSSLVLLIASAALIFGMSWQLALLVAIVPPAVAGLAWVVTRPLRPASRRVQDKAAEIGQRIQENLSGIREVVAFRQERAQNVAFAAAQRELQRLRMRLAFMDTGLQTGQTFFSLFITLVILGYGGYMVVQGLVSLGTLFAVRTLFSYIYTNLGSLFGTAANAQRSLAAADRVLELLDQQPAVLERPLARAPRDVRGDVTFDRVSFDYVPDRPVLRDVSFTAHAGQLVALVGPSGAGKSTIASLIARFFDPSEGRVLLDGVDLRDLTLEGLRSQIGMVFQDSFLFATTIAENIAIGAEGATAAEILDAAHAANAWEFIASLPEGMQTQVGQRGVQLSEGQKQRIAIARALLRDPRVLILDEPSSALDARSEHLLQGGLENLMRGRTTFVIAHRLATIRRADEILVVEQGRIVEHGTHSELVKRDGLYREFFDLQFGHVHGPASADARVLVAAG